MKSNTERNELRRQAILRWPEDQHRHSTEVWEYAGERGVVVSRYCRVTAIPCHFCCGFELAPQSVEFTPGDPRAPEYYVGCAGCGARGPWGRTELEAVAEWNGDSNIEFRSPWTIAKAASDGIDADIPY